MTEGVGNEICPKLQFSSGTDLFIHFRPKIIYNSLIFLIVDKATFVRFSTLIVKLHKNVRQILEF